VHRAVLEAMLPYLRKHFGNPSSGQEDVGLKGIGDGPELFAGRASAAHLDSNSTGHHDAPMRTTVTLEPDIAASLKEFAHRSRTTFKAALNTVLRRGLAAQVPDAKRGRRFVVEPHDGRFKPGLDLARLNQLTDQLETEAFVAKARGRR
jgi:hypothetical protein